jgi:hypothetical protein
MVNYLMRLRMQQGQAHGQGQAQALGQAQGQAQGQTPVNTLAQGSQPPSAPQGNALQQNYGAPIDMQRDRTLQELLANKLALDGPHGDFWRALQDFNEHFSRRQQEAQS